MNKEPQLRKYYLLLVIVAQFGKNKTINPKHRTGGEGESAQLEKTLENGRFPILLLFFLSLNGI